MKVVDGVLVNVKPNNFKNGCLIVPEGTKIINDNSFKYLDHLCAGLKKVILPEGVEEIGDRAFIHFSHLEEINFPKSLKKIGKGAFEHTRLKKADLTHVEFIDEHAFYFCTYLKKVKLNENLTIIKSATFYNCSALKRIKIPKNIERIEWAAFAECHNLTEAELNENLKAIEASAFRGCEALWDIDLPQGLKEIGGSAFAYCKNLRKLIIPESVENMSFNFKGCIYLSKFIFNGSATFIDEKAFDSCSRLKYAYFQNVEIIKERAFYGCINLKNLILPQNLKEIRLNAFNSCFNLKKLFLPNSLKSIADRAFYASGLEEIVIPENVKDIKEYTFYDCEKLKKVVLPESLTQVFPHAFENCSNLREINFPKSLNSIGMNAFKKTGLISIEIGENIKAICTAAFEGCVNLQKVNILGPVHMHYMTFLSCPNLKEIYLPNAEVLYGEIFKSDKIETFVLNKNCKNNEEISLPYLAVEDNCFHMAKFPIANAMETNKITYLRLEVLNILLNMHKKYLKECENPNVRHLYNFIQTSYENDIFINFVENKNITFFKNLNLYFSETTNSESQTENIKDFIKLYYNLGGFLQPLYETSISKSGNEIVKKVDYAQIVGEFMKENLNKQGSIFNLENMHMMFESMDIVSDFKKEFAKFFLDKATFEELLKEEDNGYYGFIARCFNEFEEVQKTNTSNRGSQRQLKPTIEKFKEYFRNQAFKNITPETIQIADTIAPYFSKQEDFDRAVEIDNERKKKQVQDHILGEPVVESDIFAEIERLKNEIENVNANTLSVLTDLSNKTFTFEWLAKNDPKNFILGKLCSCCAHLEGVGYGIMHASIVHPDVQNLVIRDRNNHIVAKSTLYINRKEGYGVFNNVEISVNVEEKDKQVLYKKYITAVKLFAKKYNEKNPKNPLKQINVGVGLNDLIEVIDDNHNPSPVVLSALNYGDYGIEHQSYNGDSSKDQYILWKKGDKEMEG